MSMEISVLLQRARLPDVRRWQAAIDALGFDVKLDPSMLVDTNSGFVPATFRGRDGGFEFDLFPASEMNDAYPELATHTDSV